MDSGLDQELFVTPFFLDENFLIAFRPHPHVSCFAWKRRIFSVLAYRPHIFRENGHRKCIFSKTLPRVKIFQNAGLSSTCVRRKRWVIHHVPPALRMLCEGAILFPFWRVFVWTDESDSNTLRVDAYVFENRGKNISVFKNIRIRLACRSIWEAFWLLYILLIFWNDCLDLWTVTLVFDVLQIVRTNSSYIYGLFHTWWKRQLKFFVCVSFFFQGMNEIIGPLYYVFCSDPNSEWQGKYFELSW